jgi:hypothetical protein
MLLTGEVGPLECLQSEEGDAARMGQAVGSPGPRGQHLVARLVSRQLGDGLWESQTRVVL